MTSASVSRTERLLNLVIALLSTRGPLSRASIQATVAGYDSGASVAAFERMFERDKEELRAMGVPIRTIADVHGEVQGYVVDSEEYASRDLDLTAEEITVLNIAAQLWDDAVLEAAALTAVRKLESLAGEQARQPVATFGVLTARDAALLPLLRAVRDRRVVRFDYRKPGSEALHKRSVEPWSVHSTNGRWYLVGWDTEKQEQRAFRLSRMSGPVQVTAMQASTQPTGGSDWQMDVDDDVTVDIHIPPGLGAELRRLPSATTPDGTSFRITGGRQQILTLLWRADPRVTVTAPQDVIEEFRAGLRQIEQAHA
jgi:predicted DNA-binding transcriptional regulator YafY